MSRRESERERVDRSARVPPPPPASARTNEYFVPKDGIDREVITADICRYLGNDALVRPGNYENPTTRTHQAGYFITAYRNLTSAMIEDLKADSARWAAERSQTASAPRGQPNVEYRSSQVHHSRQYYGPTSADAPPAPQEYAAPQGYQPAVVSPQQQGVYDPGSQYQGNSYASQPALGYTSAPQGYVPQDSYYVAGANMAVDPQRSDRAIQQPRTVPNSAGNVPYGHSNTPTYQQPPDSRYYGQPGPSAVSSAQYAQQPSDPFYGRAAPTAGSYDTSGPEIYDSRVYQQDIGTGGYSQPPMSSASSTTATAGSSRRERDRDSEPRENRHGHRNDRNRR